MYTKPTIELENILVEEGIAMSLTEDFRLQDEDGSAGYLEENIW